VSPVAMLSALIIWSGTNYCSVAPHYLCVNPNSFANFPSVACDAPHLSFPPSTPLLGLCTLTQPLLYDQGWPKPYNYE